jgi:hypothetical protein
MAGTGRIYVKRCHRSRKLALKLAFQVISYCTTMDLHCGVLIYPKHLSQLEDEIWVRCSPIRSKRIAIDFNKEVGDMPAECGRVCKSIAFRRTSEDSDTQNREHSRREFL